MVAGVLAGTATCAGSVYDVPFTVAVIVAPGSVPIRVSCTVFATVNELFDALALWVAPPPETVAVAVTSDGADALTLTVTAMTGYADPAID